MKIDISNLYKIQLVSQSPRRKEILSKMYKDVIVVDIPFDEKVPVGMDVELVAAFLAEQKMANFLQSKLRKQERIITADTIVCYPKEGKILGKPKNIAEAREMLLYHYGKEHLVVTSVCYVDTIKNSQRIITDKARVIFKSASEIPEEALTDYLSQLPPKGPMDKAGAYGIQEEQVYMHMIADVKGDINTVIGFPLEKFISVVINGSSRDMNA